MSHVPVLDFERTTGAPVEESAITGEVEETGQWVVLPIRSAVRDTGPQFEIGPYSLIEEDAVELARLLARHLQRFSSPTTTNQR